jgi:S1-C subfamily serine protease
VSGTEGDDGASERDETPNGPRPDPLDRPWVHPSELHSYVANPLPPVQARPREWVIGLVSATVGIAATLLVLVAFGALGERNRSPLPPPAIIPPNAVIDYAVAARVSQAGGPSIVTVRATAGDTTTVGSGVAVSSNRVLTSAHLLILAGTVVISTSDGSTFPAKVMGWDADTDLSLLDASGADLSYRPLADAPPDVGEPVVAVATTKGDNPFVAINVVSRVNRMVTTNGATIAGLLQANLLTAPETSGGALFDTNGQIVGILVTPPGVSDAGLAVPIDVADDVRQQIEASGKVTHGWLGLTAVDAGDRPGARVTGVAADSPAADAKLEVGDVITGAGGHNVGDVGDLIAEWQRRRPADSLTIQYHRGRVPHSTTATLTAGPPPAAPPDSAGN